MKNNNVIILILFIIITLTILNYCIKQNNDDTQMMMKLGKHDRQKTQEKTVEGFAGIDNSYFEGINNVEDCIDKYQKLHGQEKFGLWSGKEHKCYAYINGSLNLPLSFNKNDPWYIKYNNDPFWQERNLISKSEYYNRCNECSNDPNKIYVFSDAEDMRKVKGIGYITVDSNHDGKTSYDVVGQYATNICLPYGYVAYLNAELDPFNENYYLLTKRNCRIPQNLRVNTYIRYSTIEQHIKRIVNIIRDKNAKIAEKNNYINRLEKVIRDDDTTITNLSKQNGILNNQIEHLEYDLKKVIDLHHDYINDLRMSEDMKNIIIANTKMLNDDYNAIDLDTDIILYSRHNSNRFIKVNYELDNGGNVIANTFDKSLTQLYYMKLMIDKNYSNYDTLIGHLSVRIWDGEMNRPRSHTKSYTSGKYLVYEYDISNLHHYNSYNLNLSLSSSNSNFDDHQKVLNSDYSKVVFYNSNYDKLYETDIGKWYKKQDQSYNHIKTLITPVQEIGHRHINIGIEPMQNFPRIINNKSSKSIRIPSMKSLYYHANNNIQLFSKLNIPLINMEIQVYDRNDTIKYLRKGTHEIGYVNKIHIKNTPPERNGNEVVLIGETKSLGEAIKEDLDKEDADIKKILTDNEHKSKLVEKALLDKKTRLCNNASSTSGEFGECKTVGLTEGFANELKARSLVNSDEISIIPMDNDKFNIQVNGQCLTVHGDKEYKLMNCVKTNSQKFNKHLIRDKYDNKIATGKIGSDDVSYPYEIFSSEITNSCLTIDPDGVSVQPCIPEDRRQHWLSSINPKLCVVDER